MAGEMCAQQKLQEHGPCVMNLATWNSCWYNQTCLPTCQ